MLCSGSPWVDLALRLHFRRRINMIEQELSRVLVDGSGRGPEARIPRAWMKARPVSDLSDNGYRVWVALWSFADSQTGRSCYPSVRTLCDVTGKGRSTIYRGTQELEASGLVVKVRNGRTSTDYTLTDPSKVDAQNGAQKPDG